MPSSVCAAILATIVAQTGRCRGDLPRRPRRHRQALDVPGPRGRVGRDRGLLHTGSARSTVQNTYRSPLTGQPTITVATPLFDADGKGQRVAVIAANLSLAPTRPDRSRTDRSRRDRQGVPRRAGGRPDPGERSGTGHRGTSFGRRGCDRRGPERARAVRGCDRRAGGRRVPLAAGSPGGARRRDDPGRGVLAGPPARPRHRDRRATSTALLAAALWFVARRVTRPILSLAATATQGPAGRPRRPIGDPARGRGRRPRRGLRRDDRRAQERRRDARAPGRGSDGRAEGRTAGGRLSEPGQERVPRGDEPRDPDADERRHRDDRAAADDRR